MLALVLGVFSRPFWELLLGLQCLLLPKCQALVQHEIAPHLHQLLLLVPAELSAKVGIQPLQISQSLDARIALVGFGLAVLPNKLPYFPQHLVLLCAI